LVPVVVVRTFFYRLACDVCGLVVEFDWLTHPGFRYEDVPGWVCEPNPDDSTKPKPRDFCPGCVEDAPAGCGPLFRDRDVGSVR
jgi:hypothetical protein